MAREPWQRPPVRTHLGHPTVLGTTRPGRPRFRRHGGSEQYDEIIDPWTPEFAKEMFLKRYSELTGETPRR